ncbi:MAG TPA: cell division protein ZapA [Spirochaetota bacterium]|nr:cell division protein ZapA [Spirochaetota bacterium]
MNDTAANKVKVAIFGQTYTIRGDAPPDYIEQLADYVNAKMEEVAAHKSSSNPTQIAILVALNIADEYFQIRQMKGASMETLEEKTRELISMLDEGLIGDVFSRV